MDLLSRLRSRVGWVVLRVLAEECGVVKFNDIRLLSGLESSYVSHALSRLVDLGLVEKLGKGSYTVRFKTPFCFVYSRGKLSVKLVSLLGLRNSRVEPEPAVARSLLEGLGYRVSEVVVVTTERAVAEWGGLLGDFSVKVIDSRDATSIQRVEEFVSRIVDRFLHDEVIILDLTSLTKPATIAFYNLAVKKFVPLIYVYEETRELYWIQDRELLRDRIESIVRVKV